MTSAPNVIKKTLNIRRGFTRSFALRKYIEGVACLCIVETSVKGTGPVAFCFLLFLISSFKEDDGIVATAWLLSLVL